MRQGTSWSQRSGWARANHSPARTLHVSCRDPLNVFQLHSRTIRNSLLTLLVTFPCSTCDKTILVLRKHPVRAIKSIKMAPVFSTPTYGSIVKGESELGPTDVSSKDTHVSCPPPCAQPQSSPRRSRDDGQIHWNSRIFGSSISSQAGVSNSHDDGQTRQSSRMLRSSVASQAGARHSRNDSYIRRHSRGVGSSVSSQASASNSYDFGQWRRSSRFSRSSVSSTASTKSTVYRSVRSPSASSFLYHLTKLPTEESIPLGVNADPEVVKEFLDMAEARAEAFKSSVHRSRAFQVFWFLLVTCIIYFGFIGLPLWDGIAYSI